MSATRPLPRRLDATDDDLRRARDAAHTIAATTLGRDPGPMATAASMSHYVYIGADVVVKLVDIGGHNRLELEIALAPHLPSGLGAPLLSSGRRCLDTCDVRYACFTRMPGASPGVGLPDVNAATARRWAEQAARRLDDLHTWMPTGAAEQALKESPAVSRHVRGHSYAQPARCQRRRRRGASRCLLRSQADFCGRAPDNSRVYRCCLSGCDARSRSPSNAAVPPGVASAITGGGTVEDPVRLWHEAVHQPGIYDLEVDTSILRPEQCADLIAARLVDARTRGHLSALPHYPRISRSVTNVIAATKIRCQDSKITCTSVPLS
jgi:Chloramphenicol phosphotransferase-like protein